MWEHGLVRERFPVRERGLVRERDRARERGPVRERGLRREICRTSSTSDRLAVRDRALFRRVPATFQAELPEESPLESPEGLRLISFAIQAPDRVNCPLDVPAWASDLE